MEQMSLVNHEDPYFSVWNLRSQLEAIRSRAFPWNPLGSKTHLYKVYTISGNKKSWPSKLWLLQENKQGKEGVVSFTSPLNDQV